MEIRVFTAERCLDHVVPRGFPESPERLLSLLAGLRRAGLEIVEVVDHPEAADRIARVHDAAYLDRFKQAVSRGEAFLDSGDNPLSRGTWEAATAAVQATLRAVDWTVDEADRTAVAAVRPPGHHAERGSAMGFCYLNSVAVAAEHLLCSGRARRIAIVDFDVHHGNGTQHLFEERSELLYVSLHRHPFYPGTGWVTEEGRGEGRGATVNVALAAGSGDRSYGEAFQQTVLPVVRRFGPDFLLISAGFDAWQRDPIGGMRVSERAFRDWGLWLGQLASEHCEGRAAAVLEGGYDIPALPRLMLAHLGGLVESRGVDVSWTDR